MGESEKVNPEDQVLFARRAGEPAEDAAVNQTIQVALYTLQRERATADQIYQRARNALTVTVTLFGLVQTAFLSTLSGKLGGKYLLSASERDTVAWAAGVSLLFVITGLVVLQFVADRSIQYDGINDEDLLDALTGSSPDELTTGQVLVAQLLQEERAWEAANKTRRTRATVLSTLSGLAASGAIIELVLLYYRLR